MLWYSHSDESSEHREQNRKIEALAQRHVVIMADHDGAALLAVAGNFESCITQKNAR